VPKLFCVLTISFFNLSCVCRCPPWQIVSLPTQCGFIVPSIWCCPFFFVQRKPCMNPYGYLENKFEYMFSQCERSLNALACCSLLSVTNRVSSICSLGTCDMASCHLPWISPLKNRGYMWRLWCEALMCLFVLVGWALCIPPLLQFLAHHQMMRERLKL
jgi:hypothetical protein